MIHSEDHCIQMYSKTQLENNKALLCPICAQTMHLPSKMRDGDDEWNDKLVKNKRDILCSSCNFQFEQKIV